MSPTGQLPPLDHSLPAWPCFRAGEEGRDALISLRPRDVFALEDREGARSQALLEPARNWRGVGGEGRTRQAEEQGRVTAAEELRAAEAGERKAGEKRNRKVVGGGMTGPTPAPGGTRIPVISLAPHSCLTRGKSWSGDASAAEAGKVWGKTPQTMET